MDIKKVQSIRDELNEFSFTKVIVKKSVPQGWEKDISLANETCCFMCENMGNNVSSVEKDNKKYNLRYVSHGAHSLDFCASMGIKPENDWNDIPVLFLFENPSIQYAELYQKQPIENKKYPALQWYWINKYGYNKDDCVYPKCYKQLNYGGLIASLIKTFKLGNAYMTNVIKCSMNTEDGKKSLGTSYYHNDCIKTCVNNILTKEVNILIGNDSSKKLIIFAFSKQVYNLAIKYLIPNLKKIECQLCLLPHPASRLSNDYRKYVIFGKVYKLLHLNKIDCHTALDEFLKNDTSFKVRSIDLSNIQSDLTILTKELQECAKKENYTLNSNGAKKLTKNNNLMISIKGNNELICRFKINERRFHFVYSNSYEDEIYAWDEKEKKYFSELTNRDDIMDKLYKTFSQYIEKFINQI